MNEIIIIAAIDKRNAIGFQNKLLYWLPNDLKRFKTLTTGNTLVMGRKTFESLPNGALPNRRNIVISSNRDLSYANAEIFSNFLEMAEYLLKENYKDDIKGKKSNQEKVCKAHVIRNTTRIAPEHFGE